MRGSLRFAGLFYSAAIRIRNWFYDKRFLGTNKASVPVISVGNITAGGTGKTPLVALLAGQISANNKCAILTRGYKTNQGISDEVALLSQACPGIPVVVNPNRVTGAAEAVTQGASVLLMDDGFQHRRLGRDLDIVTIDATCPFGFARILPAGLLREPVSSLKRADAVVITRADQVEQEELQCIEKELLSIKADLVIAHAVHRPACIVYSAGGEMPLTSLRQKKVSAFCGIGNPEAFFVTCRSLGAELLATETLDDHHHYLESDIERFTQCAKSAGAELVLTTEKDLVKIDTSWLSKTALPFACVRIEIELIKGRQRITELIQRACAGKIAAST